MANYNLNKTKPRTTTNGYEASSPNQGIAETMITNNTSSPSDRQPLVTPCKTPQTSFHLYPRTVKIKKPFLKEQTPPPPRNLTTISGFSNSSRRNLKFKAANSSHLLRSQFGLSYGDNYPTDGRICKKHFNLLNLKLSRKFPFFLYLWIAEFQSRGALHFHLFTNIKPTEQNRRIIAEYWCDIVNSTDKETMLKVHNHPKNFIPWNMGTGSYLCKYLDKHAQKSIPENFTGFGRFWGNSRNLIPEPEITTAAEIEESFPQVNTDTGEINEENPVKFLIRTIGKHHEKYNRKSWIRQTNKSTSNLTGANIYRQTLAYLEKTRGTTPNTEPF